MPIPSRPDARGDQHGPAGADGCAPGAARRGRSDHRRALRGGAAALPPAPTPFVAGGHDVRHRVAARAWCASTAPLLRAVSVGGARPRRALGATTVTIVGRDGTRILHPRMRFGQRSSTTGTTCRSSRRNRRRCARCSPSCCAIWAPRFPPSGRASRGPPAARAARLLARGPRPARNPGVPVVGPALDGRAHHRYAVAARPTPARSGSPRGMDMAVPPALATSRWPAAVRPTTTAG